MEAAHAHEVLAIFQAGIHTGLATFEVTVPTWEAFDAARLPEHRFVALSADGSVLGWVACSAVSRRAVYARVVEHSVYVHPDARGRGIGGLLLDALISSTEEAGVVLVERRSPVVP